MYADYSYYTSRFGGDLVPEASWERAAGAASDWMDAATFGRLQEGIPSAWETQIRRCCCELAEVYYTDAIAPATDAETGAAVASETNSTYSITYRSTAENAAALLYGAAAGMEDQMLAVVRKHLGRTGLLFRGCC